MNKILLVDDDLELTQLLTEILTLEGFDVTVAEDGEEGLLRLAEQAFDLVLLDVMMPRLNGFAMLTRLRKTHDTPVLMLTARGDSQDRVNGLEAGADDYLAKPFESVELIARLRALIRRATNATPGAVMIYGDIGLHVKARNAHRQGKHVALSPREFEILKFMMDHAGDIVTREMLLREVWNLAFDPQTNVIDVSMSRLRQRLDEGFDTPAIETVRGAGYRLVGGLVP